MFDGGKKRPSRAFLHAPDCKIMKADPTTEIPWSEVGTGHWRAECQCRIEHFHEAPADSRTRLDLLDPSSFRHAGQCEHRDTTDPTLLAAILKVTDGAGDDYWWVQCSACDPAWPVSHYAAARVV
jgi:hypothetical protein